MSRNKGVGAAFLPTPSTTVFKANNCGDCMAEGVSRLSRMGSRARILVGQVDEISQSFRQRGTILTLLRWSSAVTNRIEETSNEQRHSGRNCSLGGRSGRKGLG